MVKINDPRQDSIEEYKEILIELATDIKWIKKSLESLQRDVEDLKMFKWKTVGVAIGVSATISTIISVVVAFLT